MSTHWPSDTGKVMKRGKTLCRAERLTVSLERLQRPLRTYKVPVPHTGDDIAEDHPQITLKKGLQRALRGRIGILRRELRIGCRDFQRESVVRTLSKKCSIVSTVFSHLSQKPLTSPSRSSHYI